MGRKAESFLPLYPSPPFPPLRSIPSLRSLPSLPFPAFHSRPSLVCLTALAGSPYRSLVFTALKARMPGGNGMGQAWESD